MHHSGIIQSHHGTDFSMLSLLVSAPAQNASFNAFEYSPNNLNQLLRRQLAVQAEQRRYFERLDLEEKMLSFLQMSDTQDVEDLIPERHRQTCEWILRTTEWNDWASGLDCNVLFLLGGPGVGKSVLTKYLLRHLSKTKGSADFDSILAFFCKDVPTRNDTAIILKHFLHRILSARRDLFRHIFPKYTNVVRLGGEIGLESLWHIFFDICTSIDEPLYFLIDGLDECEIRSRMKFLRLLEESFMQQSQPTRLHIFISSRDYTDITETASLLSRIEMTAQTTEADLTRYISDRIARMGIVSNLPTPTLDFVRNYIEEEADGLFLWVSLVFDIIDRPDRMMTSNQLMSSLKAMPSTLVGLYAESVTRIPKSQLEDAQKMLAILLYAAEPLRDQEFAILFSTWPEEFNSHADLMDNLPLGILRYARTLCGPLVKVSKDSIQLGHQTVREFLVKSAAVTSTDLALVDEQKSLTAIASSCLRYLLLQDFESGLPIDAEASQRYPFLDYAAEYWPLHIKECDIPNCTELRNLLSIFLDEETPRYQSWSRNWGYLSRIVRNTSKAEHAIVLNDLAAYGLIYVIEVMRSTEPDFQSSSNPVASRGFPGLLDSRATVTGRTSDPAEADSCDSLGNTALMIATDYGEGAIIKFMVQQRSNPYKKNHKGRCALHSAASKGDMTILNILLNHADSNDQSIDVKDSTSITPLHLASASGRSEAIRALIEQGADPNLRTRRGSSAIHFAATNGHEDSLLALIQAGAEVDSVNKFGSTALMLACLENRQSAVETLIAQHANINAKANNGRTAMHYAAQNDNLAILVKLAQAGLAKQSRDNSDTLPLHLAAKGGHISVVRWLLPEEFSTGSFLDLEGKSPLMYAAEGGQTAVMVMLSAHGDSCDLQTGGGATALHYAASAGNLDAVSWLLGKGLSPNTPSNNGMTPFLQSAFKGSLNVTKLLYESGGLLSDKDTAGHTLLHAATHAGNTILVEWILSQGADINAVTDTGYTPLHVAVSKNVLQICQLLLDHGADITAASYDGTALHLACINGYSEMIDWLLEKDAFNATLAKGSGLTSLHLAAQWGHKETVEILLRSKHPIDAVSLDTQRTPLHLAVQHHFPDVIQLLVEAGANPNLRDYYHRTALDWANLHEESFVAFKDWCTDYVPTEDYLVESAVRASIGRILIDLSRTTEFDVKNSYWHLGNLLLYLKDDNNAGIAFEQLISRFNNDQQYDLGLTCDRCGWGTSDEGDFDMQNIIDETIFLCRTCSELGFCKSCFVDYDIFPEYFRGCIGHELVEFPRPVWYSLKAGDVDENGWSLEKWLQEMIIEYAPAYGPLSTFSRSNTG